MIIDNDFCGTSSLSALRKLDVPIIAHLWNHKEKKQAEPAKQGRPESIVTKKPLENQRKNKSDKHNRAKKTAEKKNMRRETTKERERERERERQKRKTKALNQKFVIIDNDFCGISSLSALRKLDVPIIAHLWNHKEKKQAEPAKQGRPESTGTKKRLESHREKINHKHNRTKKQQRRKT